MSSYHPEEQYDTEYADVPEATNNGGLAYLDSELKRLHGTIDQLVERLTPVLRQQEEKAMSDPNIRPMPATPFRERVERLSAQTGRIDRLLRDLDL